MADFFEELGLGALKRDLEDLTKKPHQVVLSQSDKATLAREVARELSKPGGPQIAQRAIAQR
jgi:hypothetical protein